MLEREKRPYFAFLSCFLSRFSRNLLFWAISIISGIPCAACGQYGVSNGYCNTDLLKALILLAISDIKKGASLSNIYYRKRSGFFTVQLYGSSGVLVSFFMFMISYNSDFGHQKRCENGRKSIKRIITTGD